MTLTKTPICNFGEKAKDFNLLSTEKEKISLDMVKGDNGTLVMFICNHCPYVKAVIKDIVEDVKFLEDLGIKSVAIMSNDVKNYPEDSFKEIFEDKRISSVRIKIEKPDAIKNADSVGVEIFKTRKDYEGS